MKIYDNMSELIGNTPLLRAERFKVAAGGGCEILVKLERFNPGGSVKDRVALAMIEDAEKRGVLKRGSVKSSRRAATRAWDSRRWAFRAGTA